MAGLSTTRPWEIVLAARVAREFYVEGQSMVNDDDWTPQTLAERLPGFFHVEETAGGLRLPPLMAR